MDVVSDYCDHQKFEYISLVERPPPIMFSLAPDPLRYGVVVMDPGKPIYPPFSRSLSSKNAFISSEVAPRGYLWAKNWVLGTIFRPNRPVWANKTIKRSYFGTH